jgi:hypothetical protein
MPLVLNSKFITGHRSEARKQNRLELTIIVLIIALTMQPLSAEAQAPSAPQSLTPQAAPVYPYQQPPAVQGPYPYWAPYPNYYPYWAYGYPWGWGWGYLWGWGWPVGVSVGFGGCFNCGFHRNFFHPGFRRFGFGHPGFFHPGFGRFGFAHTGFGGGFHGGGRR